MLSCCVASTWLLKSPSNGPVRAGEEPARTRARARVLAGAGPTGRLASAGWNRLDQCSAADGVLTEEPMMPFDPGVSLSAGRRADEFILRPITAADARLDYEAVMDSREYLRQWEQSTWPEDDFTVADNQSDLVDLERWNSENLAFTYTIPDPSESRCLGRVYILPRPRRSAAAARSTRPPKARGNGRTSTRPSVTGFAGGRWTQGWMRPC